MAKVIIRKAKSSDAAGMAALEKICFAKPWSYEDFRHELEENKIAVYIVASAGDEIIGCAGVWRVLDEGHITNVSVHPGYRGRNIATEIIARLLKEAEAEGVTRFTLEVRPSNISALRLYDKFDFEKIGKRKGYYSDNGEDALIMWRGDLNGL